jgi:hypothetical protein
VIEFFIAKLTDNYLLSAAQNMEERIAPFGTILIQQDDIGDSVCCLHFVDRSLNPNVVLCD